MADYEDLTIDQGTDVAIELHLVDPDGSKKNLNGYTASATMKRSYSASSDDSDTVNFTTLIPEPKTDGVITLSLDNTVTDALNTRGRYVYDVEISFEDSDGNEIIERVLEGKIKVTPSVSR
jgi:hypothetical protein